MEIKHISEVGYKDVKMIFQAEIGGKFYNFEITFLLQSVYQERSKSHLFYEFTRQFGVHKAKKTMDEVLLQMIAGMEPKETAESESDAGSQAPRPTLRNVETLGELSRRISQVLIPVTPRTRSSESEGTMSSTGSFLDNDFCHGVD
jgi:hypothetical protein